MSYIQMQNQKGKKKVFVISLKHTKYAHDLFNVYSNQLNYK